MSLKKAPKEITTEELLKALDTPVEEKPVEIGQEDYSDFKNDIFSFLAFFELTPGEFEIKKNVLYSIYFSWSEDPMKRSKFYQCMSAYIPLSSGLTKYYTINKPIMKLTYEAYKKFKKEAWQLKSKNFMKQFKHFLGIMEIKPGEFWIERELLHFIYDKYTLIFDKTRKGVITEQTFYKFCDIFFKYTRTKNGIMYAVNEEVTKHFQPGQLERMRKEYAQKKRPKKRNKKKHIKVSGTRS